MKFPIILICISNLVFSQENKSDCIENEKFKKYFFENISIAQKHGQLGEKNISKALDEINLYVNTDGFEIGVYAGIKYPSDEVCNKLIDNWIAWYEQNKCKNLKKHRKRFHRKDWSKNR